MKKSIYGNVEDTVISSFAFFEALAASSSISSSARLSAFVDVTVGVPLFIR